MQTVLESMLSMVGLRSVLQGGLSLVDDNLRASVSPSD